MPPGRESANRVAIVGASSLRGKELKQVLEDRKFSSSDIILLDESVMAGTLTEAGGEPTFIRAIQEDSFDGVRFAFYTGTAFDTERNWLIAQNAGAAVIDMTGAVTTSGRVITAIPSLASILPAKRGPGPNGSANPIPYFSPPTAVIIACTLAAGLAKFLPQRLVILLFPPVSERERPGIEELENQTTNLLSFRPIEQTIFDAQVAFNLLAAYGSESKPSLADMRAEIARHVANYLAGRAPTPAIQLVQAPVFYGYAFAAYAEIVSPQTPEQLAEGFANLGVRVGAIGDSSPTNISAVGENEIQLARIETDTNIAGGVWLWGVADNLRVAATNAVRIAEGLIGNFPVQS